MGRRKPSGLRCVVDRLFPCLFRGLIDLLELYRMIISCGYCSSEGVIACMEDWCVSKCVNVRCRDLLKHESSLNYCSGSVGGSQLNLTRWEQDLLQSLMSFGFLLELVLFFEGFFFIASCWRAVSHELVYLLCSTRNYRPCMGLSRRVFFVVSKLLSAQGSK